MGKKKLGKKSSKSFYVVLRCREGEGISWCVEKGKGFHDVYLPSIIYTPHPQLKYDVNTSEHKEWHSAGWVLEDF